MALQKPTIAIPLSRVAAAKPRVGLPPTNQSQHPQFKLHHPQDRRAHPRRQATPHPRQHQGLLPPFHTTSRVLDHISTDRPVRHDALDVAVRGVTSPARYVPTPRNLPLPSVLTRHTAKPATALIPIRAASISTSSRRDAASLTAHGPGSSLAKPRKEVPLPSEEGTKGVIQYALYAANAP